MARTLEDIKGRCIIEVGDDCKEHWIWQGATNRDGQCIVRAPDYGRDATGQTTYNMGVDRAIHMVTKRKPVRRGYQFFRTCLVPLCVNPDCCAQATKKRGGVHVSRKFKSDPVIQARLSASSLRSWDKRGRKVSDEVVRKVVMDSHKTNKEVALEHGLDQTTVAHYRSGRLRKQAAAAVLGPFAALVR